MLFLAACGSGGGGQPSGPTVAAVNPADQATNVPIDSSIQAKFSTKVDPVTVNDKNFFILDTTGQMAGAVTYEDGAAVFRPSQSMGKGKQYSAVLTTGIKDLDGIPLPSNFTWSFTTEGTPEADKTPPTIISTIPPSDKHTDGVPVDAPIIVTFSESMNPNTINAQTFFIKGVTGTYSYDDASHRANLTPSKPLSFSQTYQVTVTKGVTDLAGNALASDLTWDFTTAGTPDITPPKIIQKIPAVNAMGVDTNKKISITFDENVDESSLRPRFILIDDTQATVPTTFSLPDSKNATLTPVTPLQSNKTYTVIVKSGVTDLSGNPTPNDESWSFTTLNADTTPPTVTGKAPGENAASVSVKGPIIVVTFSEPIDSSTLAAPGNFVVSRQGGSSAAGLISLSADSLTATFAPNPRLEYNTTYNVVLSGGIKDLAGNPLVQTSWSFTTIDPPLVVGQSPTGQNIPLPSSIRATFSRPMKQDSINQSSFQVTQGTGPGSPVQGSVSYEEGLPNNQSAATFTPTAPFRDNTTYNVTLTTAIVDAAGNPLAADVTWSFQTAAPPDPAPTVASTSPANAAVNVPVNTAGISARFQRPIEPTTLSGSFTLQDVSGGSITPVRIEYDPLQQQATFVLPAPLNYATTYTATLGAAIHSVSGTPMGSDYAWSFTTEAAPDTTPPTVIRTDPANQSTNVPSDDQNPLLIRVDFSEAVAPASVTPSSFHVQQIDSELDKPDFPGSYTFGGVTVNFTPSTPYHKGKTYQVTLTTDITDLAGNHLQAPVVFSFTLAP